MRKQKIYYNQGDHWHVVDTTSGKQRVYRVDKKRPSKKTRCPHLGDPIERDGITIKVRCGCNGKERDQRYAAHRCDKHKRCLPDLIPTKELLDKRASGEIDSDVQLYAWCHGCPDRLAAPTA